MRKKLFSICIILFAATLSIFAQSVGGGSQRNRPREYSLEIRTNVRTAQITVERIGGNSGNALRGSSAQNIYAARRIFSESLTPGNYNVTVAAEGYYTETREISLNENTNLEINLRLITASVTITIPPRFYAKNPNARGLVKFYDNGELLRGGPVWELTPGQHTLRIESGGLWIEGTFRFEPGKRYTLEPELSLNLRN